MTTGTKSAGELAERLWIKAIREYVNNCWADGMTVEADDLRTAAAALRASPHSDGTSASAWQSIGTAPKVRGKHLRMFGDGEGFANCEFIGIWVRDHWQEVFSKTRAYPTHWQLCSPPK